MNPYSIVILCWLSGAFLIGLWGPSLRINPSGFYVIRDPTTHSRFARYYLPALTGIPNRVPLFREGDRWRYRYPGGPWVYPSHNALIEHGQTENGYPLVEE